MRKALFLIVFVCACSVTKTDQQELRSFKEEVCPAAFNSLRALNQGRVMDQENLKDTTVVADLREASDMLVTIVQACSIKSTHDTLPAPQKFEDDSDPQISPTLIASR